MSFVAVAIGGSAIAGIGGAYISSQASKSAANTQANAAQNSLDFQKATYDQQQKNYEKSQANYTPYLDIGRGATYKLSQLTGTGSNSTPDSSQFYVSPDYQFRQQQGELGIERAANARGMNLSGGTLKDLASFNSGLASTEYGNYFSRLMSLSQMGSGAAAAAGGNTAAFGNTSASMSGTIGNTTQGIGQANAAGTVGSANAWSSGINNIGNNAILAAALGKNPSAYSGGSGIVGYDNYGGNTFPKVGSGW